jgi:hypothetical protein
MTYLKRPSKFKAAIQVILAIIGALVIAAIVVIPIIINLELKLSLIDFLNRH